MQALLSEHWHAVRHLRPSLRAGVQALHRRLRGAAWVLLFDPLNQRFHRVTPEVHRVVQLFDGRRTLDDVWALACQSADPAHDGDAQAVIGQPELVQLLSQLHANDLLQTQVSPDAGEVFERHRQQERSRLRQSWLNPLSIKLPLFHPDAWFSRQAGLARRVMSLGMLCLWMLIVLPAAVLAWQHWQPLTENLSDRVLSAGNLALLWLTYPLVKAVHEWAHGLAVKAWGGNVREVGLMFLIFTPVPYVDATASYSFPSKWARAAVAAAGIMAELVLGSLALYVWLLSEPGIVTAVAFNIILIAGVSTLVVNGNPLMRYDGYYILCDLLELPNLAQRATQYWTYLIDRHAFGAHDAQPPVGSASERGWLIAYGAVAPFYRLAVSLGMVWFIASEYFFAGVLLALAGAWPALVMPLWKGWKHLTASPALASRRPVALRRAGLALGGLLGVVCLVPLPFYSVHQAVVWLPDEAIVRPTVAGHIELAHVAAGQAVQPGTPLVQLGSLPLAAEREAAEAAVQGLEARLRQAEVEDRVRAQALRSELAAQRAKAADLQRRAGEQSIAARVAGRWLPAPSTELGGRYVRRGEVLGYVVDGPSHLLRVAVTQEDMGLIASRLRHVEARLGPGLREAIPGQLSMHASGGTQELVSPALGTSGGGEIPVDPAQTGGTHTLHRVFDVEIALDRPSPSSVFGDRAHVRFDLGWTPLGWQWFLRLRQLFLSRLYV